MHAPRSSLLLLVACVTLAGCGDDGDDKKQATAPSKTATTAPAPASDRASYIAAADRVCARWNQEARRRNQELENVGAATDDTTEQLAMIEPLLRDGGAAARKQSEAFTAIEPPAADKAAIDALVTVQDARIAILEELADDAGRGDVRAFVADTARADRLRERYERLAQDFGFEQCGSVSANPG